MTRDRIITPDTAMYRDTAKIRDSILTMHWNCRTEINNLRDISFLFTRVTSKLHK